MTQVILRYGLALLGCGWALGAAAQVEERIWVNGEINGQPVRLVFDTGMSSPVLFRPAAERLKLNVTAPPANTQLRPGETLVSLTEPVDFRAQKVALRMSFGVLDLPAYLDHLPGDGALSMRAIPAPVFTFDVFHHRIELGEVVPAEALSWAKFPLVTNTPLLSFQAGGKDSDPVNVMVDTGSWGGVALSPSRWESFRAKNGGQPATLTATYTPSAGLVVSTQVWAKELVVGALSFKDVPVEAMPAVHESAVLERKTGAILGLYALRKLDLVVDVSAQAVYGRPQERPFLSFWHNQLGAVFVPLNLPAETLSAQVLKDSPAYEAGIRDGDVLLQINGEDMTHCLTQGKSPNTRFSQAPPGSTFELGLRRAGRELAVKVTLRCLLGPGSAASQEENLAKIRAAAEQGDAEAQGALGQRYWVGLGVAKDEAEAVKWLRLAAAQNQANAQYTLGLCLAKGSGVKKDEAEAVKWWRQAAEQNHVEAQAVLGMCYAVGQGVAEDKIEAYKWFLLAREQGNERAKKASALTARGMSADQIAEAQKRARQFKK